MKRILLILFMSVGVLHAQQTLEDSLRIRAIYDEVLLRGEAYENLRYLCKNIGNRLSGSENAAKAVEWGYELMNSYEFDKVWKQEIMVPKWERGDKEKCMAFQDGNEEDLSILALGSSIGTPGPPWPRGC